MADSRGENPLDETREGVPEDVHAHERDDGGEASRACSECAAPGMTLIREGDVVAIYRCPKCGHLSAPVKSR